MPEAYFENQVFPLLQHGLLQKKIRTFWRWRGSSN